MFSETLETVLQQGQGRLSGGIARHTARDLLTNQKTADQVLLDIRLRDFRNLVRAQRALCLVAKDLKLFVEISEAKLLGRPSADSNTLRNGSDPMT